MPLRLPALALLFLCALPAASAQAPLAPAAVRAAADYSRDHAGRTLLIWQNGQTVLEEAHHGAATTQPYELASGTKTFSGLIAAAAVADGFLRWDELAADTLTEWRADARKSRITVRHLLHLASGLQPAGNAHAPSYAEAIAASAVEEPGGRFVYDPVHFQAFGELMRRKLIARGAPGSPVAYLRSRVLDRIGCDVGFWRQGPDGNPLLPQGAIVSAREWVKVGELLRREGNWGGVQILPAALIRELIRPGDLFSGYGLTVWLNQPVDPSAIAASLPPATLADGLHPAGPPSVFMAAGLGGQRLYVVPTLGLVIVRQAPLIESPPRFSDDEFLSLLLPPVAPATFINVSTRGRAGLGAEALVGGFVVTGARAKTVLVRAAGPALTPFGVPGVLANPRLRLFNASQRVVKENDDWGGAFEAARLPAAFALAGAFGWTAGSRDAALLVTLVPGAYTAEVTPADGAPGVALVEVYELPPDFRF